MKELVEVSETYKHRADKLDKKVHHHASGIITEYFNPGRLDCLKGLCILKMPVRGCLHESGLNFNPDRTHSVSVEIIGD